MMKYVDKCNAFMEAQGLKMRPPVLCQDNTSTISLVTKGGGTWRSKYMRVRQASIKERLDNGDFVVEYTPTGSMIADVLTKPLSGELFRTMRRYITGGGSKEDPSVSTGVRLSGRNGDSGKAFQNERLVETRV